MSYIRCLSNPEGLYIFGSRKCIEIYGAGDFQGKFVPYHVWYGFFQKYKDNYGFWRHDKETNMDFGSYRGFRCGEVWDDSEGKRRLQVYMSYAGWEIRMWHVTWAYIANGVEQHLPVPKRKRKKKK